MTDDLTPARLAELRAIAEGATPGEWRYEPGKGGYCWVVSESDDIADVCSEREEADAAHIAAFDPPTALALLAAVERLTGERDKLQARDSEWLLAARKAIADMFSGGWKGAVPPENEPSDLYELCRGRGWEDVPESAVALVIRQRDDALAIVARLRAELAGARADERERCAKVAEEVTAAAMDSAEGQSEPEFSQAMTVAAETRVLAARIRALPAAAVLARGGDEHGK